MNTAQTTATKSITIKDIKLRTQEQRKIPVSRKFYVHVSVGDTSRSTNSAKEAKNLTSWDDIFHFDGNDSSAFLVNVYQKHHVGKNKLVGTLNNTLAYVVGKLKDGVLEETLSQDTSGGSNFLGITIKFTLAVQQQGDDTAEERQATDAHNRAIEASKSLSSVSATVDCMSSAIDTATNVESGGRSFETTWGTLLKRVELVDKTVTGLAEIHPYASMAWSVISTAHKALVNQKNRDERITRLADTMSDVLTFVQNAEPLKTIETHMKTITLLIKQVTECGYFITDYAKFKNFWTRTAKYTLSDVDERIKSYEEKFKELKLALLEGIAVQTEITVIHTMNVVKDIVESNVLDDMPYAFGARYAPEKGCLPETRESFLREIRDILNNPDPNTPRVCLLTGVAGSGKSAVAHSIARLYDEQKRLGSSYCFSSTDVATRNPQNLFSTIARDLCDHATQYRSALWEVVKHDRALRVSYSPSVQVENLIIKPSMFLDAIGPLVIVIDALDESGDRAKREDLLRVISRGITTLPTYLRFLITARPEDDILEAFPSSPQVIRIHIGDVPGHLVDTDIEKFIYHSLHQYSELEFTWPDREWCRLLVHHSQHLFQWAATACKFIKGEGTIGLDPCERLEKLLLHAGTGGGHALDDLYQTVLSQLFTSDDTQERFRNVMAIVFSLNEPLSLTSLATLLRGNPNVRAIIKPMGSLLDGSHDEEKPIRPLHTSFRDFLLDESRSLAFHVAIHPRHTLRLGRALLACMRSMLKFNICNLKDSRIHNSAIPDLPSRINKTIPHYLSYSCRYWMHHLALTSHTPDLSNEATLFFKTFFPYWLEAISLLSLSSPLATILSALETCTILKKWTKDQETATLASEAFRFIQVFSPVLRESTPHLYLSAIAQTPSSSPLYQLWLDHLQNPVSAHPEHLTGWPAEICTLQGHTDHVISVAYSPNGDSVVSGSRDNTIRIWNMTIGQCVMGPLQGHSDFVWSVAYSPDGIHVISGSLDNTIRLWNAMTGECVAEPFKGHTHGVYSVAFSPDGIHIVSGSADETIRVWDTTTGLCVAGPFEGHTDCVHSVAYSPDGTHIVSGSLDKSIRVWSATTGQCVAGPIEGHTNVVMSVAYSPNGVNIVSGSGDMTIRIWSATTGQPVTGPLQGHTGSIYSVAYSPDSRHIASASWDNTIRVWDADSGQSVAGPFYGHTNAINSVAYSPDGTYIISGSADNTIKVWDLTVDTSSAAPLKGHGDLVTSVSYSPNGTHIVSGFWDKAVKVWDATTGQPTRGLSQEHTDVVWSIAYSPDGNNIVSGSGDKTVKIWSATTGQCIAGPLHGHTDGVSSVVYSPDGKDIISGSWDKTIRVWNAETGQCVAGPFQGHSDGVISVAYSPKGTYIASGSMDRTIRVWNASTGQTVVGPFHGHGSTVCSVAYSPDGSHIVSGSNDKTIRVWNATTGQCIADPLWGHTDHVDCVAYSPDGTCVVSGSYDKTIRVWNVTTGQCIAGPFQGHTTFVTAVSYSPNGNHIVSGSFDGSVKVWDVQELIAVGNFHEEEGWLHSSQVGYLGWIAPWNRNAHQLLPVHSLVISPYPTYQVDITDSSFLGESWISCWN